MSLQHQIVPHEKATIHSIKKAAEKRMIDPPASNSKGLLKSLVERIERLKDEQDHLGEDVRGIYAEAKSAGLDKTALGQVITIRRKRRKNPSKFAESSDIVARYLAEVDG